MPCGRGARGAQRRGITFRENKNTGLKSGSRIVGELFATPVNGEDRGVDDTTLDLKEVIEHCG